MDLTIENPKNFVNDYFPYASAKRKKEIIAAFKKTPNGYTTSDEGIIEQYANALGV